MGCVSTEGITKAVTLGEAHAMFAAATTARDHLLLRLLWTTGGRITEVLSLRPGDVLDRDSLRLLNEKQGGPAVKVVFVPEDIVDEVEEYARSEALRASDWLFRGRDRRAHLSRQQGYNVVLRTGERAGVLKLKDGRGRPPWPHTFRHGAAVNLVRQGVSIVAIQDQLGHADLTSTQVYAKMFSPDRRVAVKGATF